MCVWQMCTVNYNRSGLYRYVVRMGHVSSQSTTLSFTVYATCLQVTRFLMIQHFLIMAGLESGRFLDNDIDHEDWLESK